MISLGACPHCLDPAPLTQSLCSTCQDLFFREKTTRPSPVSLFSDRWIQGAFLHEGVTRSLFSRAKFHGDGQALDTLLQQGISFLGVPLHRCLLFPVPPHRKRLLARGLSIADRMAFSWGRTWGVSYSFQGVERRNGPESKLLGREARESLSAEDRWVFSSVPKKEPVILVDDLATTGWTLRSLAQGLEMRGVSVAGAIVLCLRPRVFFGPISGEPHEP